MSIETLSGLPIHSRIKDLSAKFDRARNHQDILRSADAIAHFATKENFDSLPIIWAANKAFESLSSSDPLVKSGGTLILDGLETYFKEVRVSNKLAFDPSQKEKSSRQALSNQKNSLMKNSVYPFWQAWFLAPNDQTTVFHSAFPYPSLFQFINLVERNFVSESTERRLSIITIVSNHNELSKKHGSTFKTALENYKKVIQTKLKAFHTEKDERMKLPEQILTILEGDFGLEEIPHILTQSSGGITLQEILLGDKGDMDQLGMKILNYIIDLPRGDYFWETLVEAMFLQASQETGFRDAKEYFKNPKLAELLFWWQKWLCEKMIMPAFATKKDELEIPAETFHIVDPDSAFDQLFTTWLSRASPEMTVFLSAMIYNVAVYMSGKYSRFYPDQEMTLDTIRNWPLAQAACNQIISSGKSSRLIILDEVIYNFLRDNIDLLRRNFHQRFSKAGQGKIKQYFDFIRLGFVEGFKDMNTKSFMAEMKGYLGEFFLEKLRLKDEELNEVTKLIWQDIANDDLLLDSNHIHTVEFSPESLPRNMGFELIQYVVNEDKTPIPFEFNLVLKDYAMAVSGKITPDGNIFDLSIDVENEFPGLSTLIKLIVVSTFRDYIVSKKLIQEPNAEYAGKKTGEIRPHRQKKHEDSNPPATVVYERARERKETIVSTARIQEIIIEKESKIKGYAPRIVKRYPMTLPGIKEYRQAINAYNNYIANPDNDEESNLARREILTADINRTRDEIHRPSQEKLAKLPPDLQLEKISDPITNEEIYVQTWVKEHVKPSLTPEQVASLVKRYIDLYRSRGAPATTFLNEIKEWRFGDEDE